MKCLLAAALFVCLSSSAHAAPPSVNAEPMDVDADIVATIGKEKAKQRKKAPGQQGQPGDKSGECGSVNINSNDNKSNSGIKDMFGKKSTTVIAGPVINMSNCK